MNWLQKLMASAQGQQAPTTTPQVPAGGQMPTSGSSGEGQQQPTTQQVPATQNPLDFYSQLMQNSATPAKQAPEFNIPTENIQQAASKISFAQNIPQDAMARLQSGDMGALTEILDAVGRNAYQTAIQHNMALTGKFIEDRFSYESGNIDNRISSKLVTSNLGSIKNLHPVAQEMFRNTVDGLRSKFPHASAEELENAGWEIFQDMSSQFNRTGREQQQQQQAEEVNYDVLGGYSEPST